MAFITKKITKTTFGIIVGNRDVFPDHLAKEGREQIIEVMKEMGYDYIILNEEDTHYGVVETYEDAKKCAELFKKNRDSISGIILCMPNFSDEKGFVSALKLANFNVPILVQASSDEIDKMDRIHRRDAFCGKISVCSVLYQHGIRFSLTSSHTCPIKSEEFKNDITRFEKVCRIVKNLKGARFGQIGTRPNAFETVRYSEKILEFNGITIEPIDLSEIFGEISRLDNNDPKVKDKMQAIKNYTPTRVFPENSILKLAKLAVVVEKWVLENELDGIAIQCWSSMQDNFGIVPCAIMSMFSDELIPAACEVDIAGLIGMYILQLASDSPSAILDWNNNYGEDPNKMVLFHCSNLPKSFFEDIRMTVHPIIGDDKPDSSYGAIQGRIKMKPCTLLRIETDDMYGDIKALLVEGDYLDDPLETYGGFGVIKIQNLQNILKTLCREGFAHHVATTLNKVAEIVNEALDHYLGWNIIRY
ncbi:MAG: L-fucose/L-arabinose isomerase family protein [Promethearchaeota archaeon]